MEFINSLAQARELVESEVFDKEPGKKELLAVVDDKTRERSYGWIFFYQSRKYLETREIAHLVLGNGPIVVLRDGSIHRLGTAHPIEEAILSFEREHGLSPG